MTDKHRFDHDIEILGNIILTGNADGRDIAADGTAQDSHIADNSLHRTINDSIVGTTGLWSSDKISTELTGKASSLHMHAASDIISGTFASARISEASVTQHEAAITIGNLTGAPTGAVVGISDAQTLTNKTIDADSNTITNIDNADIKAGAAIDATKIAGGTVTNTEFGYLGSVTSDIQTQLNGKASSSHTHTASDVTDFNTATDTRITAQKGNANGLATLDGGGKVPSSQLSLTNVDYQGTWNASTNTPTITSSSGTQGHYYVVSTAGSTNIDGITDWQAGDWIIFNGSVWEKNDNTDQVTSVAGKQGAVALEATDIASGTFADARIASSNVTQHEGVITIGNLTGAPTGAVVGISDVQTLTNKTIDADSNTITNIDNADIKAGAAIDATKIAGGTVTNTEFGYIGGLTSDAQTQLNGKAASSHTHATADITSGTFANARIASSNVTQHESLLTLANQIGAPDGDFVGTTGVQTLTNKTIDADSNTITNIDNADIKAGAAIDATKIAGGTVTNAEFGYIGGLTSDAQTQLNGKAASSHTHTTADITSGTFADARISEASVTQHEAAITIGNLTGAPVGAVVGISDAQTLTNKTIDADSNTITNIDNADIKAGAAIDATKIAGGTVTNTEFGYIGGLTSDAQTQINGKAASSHTHATADITSGTFADARISSSNVTQHESLLTLANQIGAPDGDFVGTTGVQTLTNKTIDADSNTITNIDNADIKAGAAIDATKIAGGTVTNTEFGYIGGLTSDAQTQLNGKAASSHTHTKANITDFVEGDYVHVTGNETIAGVKKFSDRVVANDAGFATSYALSVQKNNPYTYLEILNNGGAGKGAFFGMEDNDFALYNWQGGNIIFWVDTVASSGNIKYTMQNDGVFRVHDLGDGVVKSGVSGHFSSSKIVNADVNASAAIDATKIAGGTVTNTEFGYLGSVTSDIQTQLNSKASSSHTHAASDITSGTFADARIAASNVTQHEAALSITESQISDLQTYALDSNVVHTTGAEGVSGEKTFHDAVIFAHATNSDSNVIFDANGRNGAVGASISKVGASGFLHLMPNSEAVQWIAGNPSAANGVNDFYIDVDNQGILRLNTLPGAGRYGEIIATHTAPLRPGADALSNLGTTGYRWKELYAVNLHGDGSDVTNIDASNIADGSVSNTEFQYLNSVTSNVQTQLDGKISHSETNLIDIENGSPGSSNHVQFKVTKATLPDTYNLGIDTSDPCKIIFSAEDGTRRQATVLASDSNSTATVFGVARSENSGSTWEPVLVARQDARVGINTNAPTDTLDVSGNIVVSGTVDGRDIAADGTAQDSHIADLSLHRTINDSIVGTTGLWSSDKINTELSGKSSTSHTHSASDITSGTFANARITQSNVTQHEGAITIGNLTGAPSSAVVGISDAQTLTNKTISSGTNTIGANEIRTTGASVVVDTAAPPTTGQVLKATSATAATWQTLDNGDVTAAANLGAMYLVVGDDGAKGVKDSMWSITADGVLTSTFGHTGYIIDVHNTHTTGGGNGLCIMAGETLGDIAIHIADADNSFQLLELEADQGFLTLGKTYAQTLTDNGVVYGVDNQHNGVSTDFNTQEGVYRIGGKQMVYMTEFQDASSDTVSETTLTTFQQKLRMTTPSLPLGKYRIAWCFEFKNNNSQGGEYRVQINNTTTICQAHGTDSSTPGFTSESGFYYASSISGVQNIDIDYRAIGGTSSIQRARLEIWRIS